MGAPDGTMFASIAIIVPFIIWGLVIGVGIYVVYLLIKALKIYIKKNS